ncbi:MAG: radical SAM protein [Bdellovibrionales bacterium]|nr:radical SAM protein [Bdellovibrionales bacterium]
MKVRRYKNIIALESDPGRYIGFHSNSFEMAELDFDAWRAMGNVALATHEALGELDEWSQEESSEVVDIDLPNTVQALSLNIAQVCNLHCTYCAAGGDGTYGSKTPKVDVSRATEQIRYFIDKLPEGETFALKFFGGEPLLYPGAIRDIFRYTELYTAGSGKKVVYSITTNGTLITPKVAELMAEMNMTVVISIDGSAEANDRARPTTKKGPSTPLTLKGIEELLKVRDRLSSISTNSVFGSHNMDILGAYHFLKQFNLDSMGLNYAPEKNDEKLSEQYCEQMALVAEAAYAEGGLEALLKITQFSRPLKNIAHQVRTENHCGAGKTLLEADTEGKLYACNWFMGDQKEVVGQDTDIFDDIKSWQNPLIEIHGCQTCWAKYLCGGGCAFMNKVKNDDKHVKDVEFCVRTRTLYALGIKYYAKSLENELN